MTINFFKEEFLDKFCQKVSIDEIEIGEKIIVISKTLEFYRAYVLHVKEKYGSESIDSVSGALLFGCREAKFKENKVDILKIHSPILKEYYFNLNKHYNAYSISDEGMLLLEMNYKN